MKNILLLGLVCVLFSCQPKVDDHSKELQNQINNLKSELSETYKPGFGEFMGNIQVHHSKLWFAGENENWKLADFEINEIKENLEAIQKYETDRQESEMIPMIKPALDSVSHAIQKQNLSEFKSSFNLLTNTCVNCHQATKHEFIQIQVPDMQIFRNQKFKIEK
ncbi:MAG: hypothetical protein JSR97_05935 [Verrucomicrobia bacterium]|nr:hypothetical protein [Verrucomicrobiota bacterium]